MSEVGVVVNIRQCHIGPENDLYGLVSMLTCASLAISCGCLDEARVVCYGVCVIASNANWQLWSVYVDTAVFL